MEYRKKISVSSMVFPPFFMSSFVMDAICFYSKFPNMRWKWTVQNPLHIHIYHKILWESQFHPHFYKICQGVMLPIHKTVFDRTTPRFSKDSKVEILLVSRWFEVEKFTYIRVFGIMSSHIMS